MEQLHPDLAHIASRYDEIVSAWAEGRIRPEEGQAQLNALYVVDATGSHWRIDPQSGDWQRSGPDGRWYAADPSEYVEAPQKQVDDWSQPGGPSGEFWEHSGPLPPVGEAPQNWAPEGDHPTWQPPVTASRQNQQAVYPAGYGAYDNPDSPTPMGYTADGYPIDDDYDEEGAGLFTRVADTFSGLVSGRGRIILIVIGVVLLGLVAKGFLAGGGRDCPGLEGVIVQDATEENKAAIECVLAAEMMTAVEFDQAAGLATFAESRTLDRRDLARSLGMTYVALGGINVSSPLPPDEAQLDPASPRTRTAAITAYAQGLIEAPVASTEPVNVDVAVLGVARLAMKAGLEGNTANAYDFLASAGIIEKDLVAGSGEAATRGDLARWLSNLYQKGLKIEGGLGLDPTPTLPGEGSTTVPTTPTTTTVPQTTTTLGEVDPTNTDVESLLPSIFSGDRQTAAAALTNPGRAETVALRVAQLAGFDKAGVAVRSGAPAVDEEGKWLAVLEAYDVGSGTVVATATVEIKRTEEGWRLHTWPSFKVVEPPAEEGGEG